MCHQGTRHVPSAEFVVYEVQRAVERCLSPYKVYSSSLTLAFCRIPENPMPASPVAAPYRHKHTLNGCSEPAPNFLARHKIVSSLLNFLACSIDSSPKERLISRVANRTRKVALEHPGINPLSNSSLKLANKVVLQLSLGGSLLFSSPKVPRLAFQISDKVLGG